MVKPQKILIVHRCFSNDCIQNASSPFNLRRHLEDYHGYVFPSPLKTTRRYNNSEYQFLRHHSDTDDVEKHHACPCCTVHAKELRDLQNHFIIDGFDITDANYCMKHALKDHQWKLSLEDHLYQLLASIPQYCS